MSDTARLYFDELWHWLWVEKNPTGTLGEKHAELQAKYGAQARAESERFVTEFFSQQASQTNSAFMHIKEIKNRIHEELAKHSDIRTAYGRGLRDNPTGIICGHNEGLPGDLKCAEVVSNYSVGDGDTMIVVTPTSVQRWFISYPCNYNRWNCRSSVDYHTPEAMVAAVRSLMNPPAGCWATQTA